MLKKNYLLNSPLPLGEFFLNLTFKDAVLRRRVKIFNKNIDIHNISQIKAEKSNYSCASKQLKNFSISEFVTAYGLLVGAAEINCE